MNITKSKMPETMYRSSRFCRVVGSPTAYLILRALQGGSLTVKEISEQIEISENAVSFALRNLRQIDVVRYETVGLNKAYWIKNSRILSILDSIEGWVDELRKAAV